LDKIVGKVTEMQKILDSLYWPGGSTVCGGLGLLIASIASFWQVRVLSSLPYYYQAKMNLK